MAATRYGAAAPQKSETPGLAGAGASGEGGTGSSDSAKRWATLAAQLALRGFELQRQPDGTLMILRWGQSRELPDLAAAEAFAQRVGVPQ